MEIKIVNISGILVQTKADEVEKVVVRLQESGLCEVYTHDELGRIVIVIEGSGIEEEISKLKQIEKIAGVITADMHYSYSEDELNLAKAEFEKEGSVPEVLNEENLRAEEIIYGGDLRKKNI